MNCGCKASIWASTAAEVNVRLPGSGRASGIWAEASAAANANRYMYTDRMMVMAMDVNESYRR